MKLFLLLLELLFFILLLRSSNRSNSLDADQDLGVFKYKDLRSEADIKKVPKGMIKNA